MIAPRCPRLISAMLLLVLVASIPAGAAVAGTDHHRSSATKASVSSGPVDAPAPAASTASRTLDLEQELQLTPDSPGEIAVTLRYTVPADVVNLTTRVPSGASVTATTGFDRRNDTVYAWNERTSTPSLTYRLSVNETVDVPGPIGGDGEYTFVDPGPWALVRIPPTATRWKWTGGGTVGLSRTTSTAGPGAVGGAMAFLGEHREVSRSANGQTFRLIIPAEASLAESPTSIFDAMASASSTLQVGDRDETVFMVAAPTTPIGWGLRGLQLGESDLWVRDIERLDTADNVWLHEYVHTRQGFAAAGDVRWFTEASATYYAALLTLEQGRIGFDAFRNRLALGTRRPDASSVLADPATWEVVAPYTKGALVAGELDRQTRLATDRTRALQDVLGRMNDHEGVVNGTEFREMTRLTGGDTTAALADRYTTTRDAPSTWDQTTHGQAFGATPARIVYALPGTEDPSGYRVSGPFRSGSLGGERPIPISVGETLDVDVRVTNTGGSTGEYDARLLVNGGAQGRQTGRLEPGESRTLTFSHRFGTVGEYTLSVGGEQVAVSVRTPADPRVVAVTASQTTRHEGTGRAVSVTAAVRNDHSIPAAANLTLRLDCVPIETRRVELAPNEERTVDYDEMFVEPGEHVFEVGGETAVVTVDPIPAPTAEPQDPIARVDGFGVVPALLAILGISLLLGRRS